MNSEVKRLASQFSLEELIGLWRESTTQEGKQVYRDAIKLSLLYEIAEALLEEGK